MHPIGFLHTFEIDAEHKLHIYAGSITEITADAVVSSDDNCLSAAGGVAAAIALAAGNGIREIYRKILAKAKAKVGDVVRTSAGALNAQHLYHAITDDRRTDQTLEESGLRRLVRKLIETATSDGVRTLAMPALGTGAALLQLDRAASVIISELVRSLAETPISNVTLALVDDDATRVFYKEALRSQADSVAIRALRQREKSIAVRGVKRQSPKPKSTLREGPLKKRSADIRQRPALTRAPGDYAATSSSDVIWHDLAATFPLLGAVLARQHCPKVVKKMRGGASKEAPVQENPNSVVEQFPSLVDEVRLAAAPPNRLKLVEGLATLILKYASETEIETELLSNPACRGFQGTVRQRLIEFLYLSERHHRLALGAALFRNRDLRAMLDELGEGHVHLNSGEDLSTAILQALCFNTLAPPTGTRQHIQNVEMQIEACRSILITTDLYAVGNQTGKILERFLHEMIALYACLFWGANFEEELKRRKLIDKSSTRSLKTTTVGTAYEIIKAITKALKKEPQLQKIWKSLDRGSHLLLPNSVHVPGSTKPVATEAVLRDVEGWRRDSVHDRTGPAARSAKDIPKLEKTLAEFHAFLRTCHSEGFYPDVLRYEGTFENRDGERFVHFLDETGKERKVRTDEKIDPRRHYYCFATNNPVHLWPVLVPKL